MTKLMEGAALALLLAMFVMAGLSRSSLPERIPTHYNVSGEPDRWGSKDSVWVLPAVSANVYLLLTVISRGAASGRVRLNVPSGFDAQSPEVQAEARQMLTAVKLLAMSTFAFITWGRTRAPEQGLGRMFVPVMLILPLGVIALYLLRMRRAGRS